MISIRTIVVSLLSFVIAVFAAPSLAANAKTYQLTNFPPTIQFGVNATPYVVRVFNTSPAGNSNFNSFRLVAPTGIKILEAQRVGTTYGANVYRPTDGTFVEVTNISPSVGRGIGFELSLKLEGLTCGAGGAWVDATASGKKTEVWSGQLTGQQFFDESVPKTSTTVGTGASLSIEFAPSTGSSPNNVFVGTGYTVSVNVASGCADVIASDTSVTLTATNATITGTNPAQTGSTGVAEFSASFGTPGPASLTASAGTLTTTRSLTVFEYGSLNCNQNISSTSISNTDGIAVDPVTGLGSSGSGIFAGLPVPGWVGNAFRALNNKNGEPCVLVDWRFDNNIVVLENPSLAENSINLEWDLGAQRSAVYQYSANFQPEPAATNGLLDPATKWRFRWYLPSGSQSDLVDGKACLSPTLPAPYGILTAPIAAGGATTTTISVNSGSLVLPAVPFPIVIDDERMVVTDTTTTSGQWSVVRGLTAGGPATLPAHGTTYSSGTSKKVMSTSFPLYTPTGSTDPKPMQMCLVEQGWTVVPWQACSDAGYPAPASPALPPACLVPYATIRDGGDGFTIRD